jgi:hypothetical protein
MKFKNTAVAVACSFAVLVACNRDRTNDSMVPEGTSASPRPVGINDTTTQRGAAQVANEQPEGAPPATPTPPAGITSGTTMGGSGGATAQPSGGLGGNKQR